MGRFIMFLYILLLFTACDGQVNSNAPTNGANSLKGNSTSPTTLMLGNKPPVDDPYFIASTDTISAIGPHSITRNILQDKNGVYWFATWQGIISYDGNQFTNHTLKEGLKKFHVFSVLEDSRGNLWFGTIRGGVYRYDPSAKSAGSKSFTLFTTIDGLVNDMVLCMLEDNKGNIWLGTDGGVSRYDHTSFTNFTTADGLSGNSVNTIMQDKAGKLWFGTRYGKSDDVCTFTDNSFTIFSNKKDFPFANVRSILEDKSGIIWIGGQDGLFRYDPSSDVLTNLTTNFIGYILEDTPGNLWLSRGVKESSDMTLTRYNRKTFTQIHREQMVFGITEDNKGNIWFGTANGVHWYDGNTVIDFSE